MIRLRTHRPRESPPTSLPKPLAWTETSSVGINSPSRAHFLKDPIGMCQLGGSLQAGARGSWASQGQFPKVVSAQAGNPRFCGWLGPGSKLCCIRVEAEGRRAEGRVREGRKVKWKERRGPLTEEGSARQMYRRLRDASQFSRKGCF